VITFQLFYFTCWATAKINAIPSSRNGIWFTVLFQVFCDQLLSSAVKWSPCPRRGLTSPTCVLSVAALTTGNSPCRVTSDCASESTSNNIYTVSQKNKTPYLSRSLREILIDFLNSFTARLGTKSAYKIIITYPGIPSYRREIAVFWLRVYITRSLVPALCSLLNDIKKTRTATSVARTLPPALRIWDYKYAYTAFHSFHWYCSWLLISVRRVNETEKICVKDQRNATR